MPIVASCPDCSRKLRVPDELLGEKVRCPGCTVVFTAVSDPVEAPAEVPLSSQSNTTLQQAIRIEQEPRLPSAPDAQQESEEGSTPAGDDLPVGRRLHEDDEYGYETAGQPSGNRAAWQKVLRGINVVLLSLGLAVVINVLGTIAAAVGMFMIMYASPVPARVSPVTAMNGNTGFLVLSLVITLLQAGHKGLEAYGHFLGMAIPAKVGPGVKTLATTAFVLSAIWLALTISGDIVGIMGTTGGSFSLNPLTSGEGIIDSALNLLAMLFYFMAIVAFLLYLRAVALAVRRKNLAKHLNAFLLTICVVTGVAFLVGVAGAAIWAVTSVSGPRSSFGASQSIALATAAFTCGGGLVLFGLFVWYIILLVQIRSAVASYARRV